MKKPSDALHTVFAVLISAFLTVLIPLLAGKKTDSLPRVYTLQGVITVLCFGLWPLLLKVRTWPGSHPEKRISVLILTAAAFGGIAAQFVFGFLTEAWIGWTGIQREPGIPLPGNFAEWAAALAVLVILPAAAEEGFFRGMMQRGFSEIMPVPAATFLTTLLFASAHMSLNALPSLLLFGAAASVLAVKGGKLTYSIAFHLTYNLTALVLSVL